MRTLLRRRPSPAMIVACIALLVALSGTGIATVASVPRNSVGTPNLRNNAVTSAKIRNGHVRTADLGNNSVDGAKVRDNSLTTFDIRNGSLLAVDFAPNQIPAGPPGAKGDKGDPGPTGPAGSFGPVTVRQSSVAISGGAAHDGAYNTGTVTVNCQSDEKAISAGAGWSDDVADRELWVQRIQPVITSGNVTGFRGTGGNDSGNSSTFTLYVLCYKG